jgi:hypothetical protein
MYCLALLVAVKLLAELTDHFSLGPGEPLIIDADHENALLAPAVALDVLG